MNLTDEQRQIGKDNMNRVVGTTRRDFLKDALGASLATGSGLGAAYYQYDTKLGDPLRIGIIGTGDEGNVLIGALNPDFIEVKAIADPRPYSQHRAFYGDWYSARGKEARPGLCKVYGYKDREAAEKDIAVYSDYKKLLERDDIEGVIIALPLFLHDVAAIDAMRAGKHVLTEKLMAHSVHQCKEMARVAKQTGLLLATGHQRHYSVLYDNAVDTIRRGVIGDLHHIRAQWHRGGDSWKPPLPLGVPLDEVKQMIRDAREISDKSVAQATEAQIKAEHKLALELESWDRVASGKHPKYQNLSPTELDEWARKVAQKRAQLEDEIVDATEYGYQAGQGGAGYSYTAQEEMIRWRLWNRTGAGLMAELGSHQLDASGIFIAS
ncbi:MAG: Gfo/Idh/MocA family oxidoreductase, partial [Planctomycetota bacterium]